MLVLNRNVNKSIMIGDDIVVTILGVDRGQVKVGVTAPDNVAVHREEIYDRIQQGIPPKNG